MRKERTFFDAIESLLIKERIDLTPQLRELDASVESVELALRLLVSSLLNDDSSRLPPHAFKKAGDRILPASKKNVSIDPGEYSALSRRLEYCDLRELQDTILSKQLKDRQDNRCLLTGAEVSPRASIWRWAEPGSQKQDHAGMRAVESVSAFDEETGTRLVRVGGSGRIARRGLLLDVSEDLADEIGMGDLNGSSAPFSRHPPHNPLYQPFITKASGPVVLTRGTRYRLRCQVARSRPTSCLTCSRTASTC